MTRPSQTEIEMRRAARYQPCPTCGAKPGDVCLTRRMTVDAPGYPPSRQVTSTLKYPHPERVAAAYRAHLGEQVA